MTMTDQLKSARRCSTPLIIIRTADPGATIHRVIASLNGTAATTPTIQWDVVRGAIGCNEFSAEALATALRDSGTDQKFTVNPAKMLQFSRTLPPTSIVFMVNLHRFASEDIGVIQSLWNLRDEFKQTQKCIIGLVPHITLPAEIAQDVLILDELMPTEAELKAIAEGIFDAAQLEHPDPATMDSIIDASLGLAAFPAEQSMAMSIRKTGMDMEALWAKKCTVIGQTPGLSVVKPTVTLDNIGGVSNAKRFMMQIINSKTPPRCFVFMDEGEKMFSGSSAGGDTSGVSQGFLMTFLTIMQEKNYRGCIFVGFPGSAKSMTAKAVAATAKKPCIMMDLPGMKNSLVGQSEANIRRAFATVEAVSQGRAYFIMTCNGIASLPPELKRRFKDCTMFFDIPDRAEKDAIWNLYAAQYAAELEGLDTTRPADEHWTGAEISTCVENAARFGVSLIDAAAYIVPAYQSMGAEKAQALREEASGRYISASYPGTYQAKRITATTPAAAAAAAPGGRSIQFAE